VDRSTLYSSHCYPGRHLYCGSGTSTVRGNGSSLILRRGGKMLFGLGLV
jgi:hypothetical protein